MSVLSADEMLKVATERLVQRQIRMLEHDLKSALNKYGPTTYNNPLGGCPEKAYQLLGEVVRLMKPQIEEQANDTTFRKFLMSVSDEKFHDER